MLNRLFDRVLAFLGGMAAAIVICMMVSIVVDSVMRYFIRRPMSWVVDFTEYSLLYITFLVAGWLLSIEQHVKVDIVFNHLSVRAQFVLNIVTSVIGLVACGMFFWYSMGQTSQAIQTGALILKASVVPKWPVWIVMPVGSLLCTLQFLRGIWLNVRRFRALDK